MGLITGVYLSANAHTIKDIPSSAIQMWQTLIWVGFVFAAASLLISVLAAVFKKSESDELNEDTEEEKTEGQKDETEKVELEQSSADIFYGEVVYDERDGIYGGRKETSKLIDKTETSTENDVTYYGVVNSQATEAEP